MKFKIGNTVTVFDRYRFAIPLLARVIGTNNLNDGVQVELIEGHGNNDPGFTTWVHEAQLRIAADAQPTTKQVFQWARRNTFELGQWKIIPELLSEQEAKKYTRPLVKLAGPFEVPT